MLFIPRKLFIDIQCYFKCSNAWTLIPSMPSCITSYERKYLVRLFLSGVNMKRHRTRRLLSTNDFDRFFFVKFSMARIGFYFSISVMFLFLFFYWFFPFGINNFESDFVLRTKQNVSVIRIYVEPKYVLLPTNNSIYQSKCFVIHIVCWVASIDSDTS